MSTILEIISKTQQETERAAQNLANQLDKIRVITLNGDLGTGKTVFARALIRALTKTPDLEVPSPTFTLIQTYNAPSGPISHFDCYRLENPDEIYEIGWEDALSEGLAIIEWPQRITPLLPATRLDITLAPVQNNPEHRHIKITQTG